MNIAATQTSVNSSSSTSYATPSSCLGDFVHENTKKLHAEVCLFLNAELQMKLTHSMYERAKLKSSVLKVGKWPVNKSELTNRHLKQLLTYIILYYIILYIYILYILTQ